MPPRRPRLPSVSKKTEQLNISLTPHMRRRLQANFRATGVKPTEFARAAISEKLRDLPPWLGKSTADALAEFKQITGQDPAPVIRLLTREHILRAQPDLKPAA